MIERTLGVAALVLAGSAMFAESALAKNIAVGPLPCQPAVAAANRYTTIQAAVNAAVINDVINVCPGQYPEQVVINKALTLKGVANDGGSLVVITVPAGGLAVNADSLSYGPIAAQVLVKDTAFVKVQNLAVDGMVKIDRSTCPAGAAAHRTAGIFYQNVAVPADAGPSSGTIGNVVVRNHADPCLDLSSLAMRSVGILTENSNILIEDNNIHTIRGDGIKQDGGIVLINRNLLMSVWDYSVKMVNARSSDARINTIIHSNHGVVVQYSTGTDVVSNIIGPYIGTGIFVTSSDATLVQSNRMNDTTTGIFLSEAQGATLTANIVQRAHTGIIVNYSGSFLFGGVPNSVKSNEVNEAVFGMRTAQPGTDTLTPNTFTNVTTTTAPY